MIGIYCIENKETGSRYIGQSVHINTRIYEHLNQLRSHKHYNTKLQNDFDEYGESAFKFYTLEECDESELSDKEVQWMDKFGGYKSSNLYNLVQGGKSNSGERNPNYGKHWSAEWKQGQRERMVAHFSDKTNHPMYGKHHSDETKEKIRNSLAGRTQPENLNIKRSNTMKSKNWVGRNNPFYGRKHSQETRDKIAQKSASRKHTPEDLEKMRKAHLGKKHSLESIGKMRRAKQKYIWIYDDKEFRCLEDLTNYLRSSEFPKIGSDTILRYVDSGFCHSRDYKVLQGRVKRYLISTCEHVER